MITISLPNADFTPAGKRSARTVTLIQGERIRWYVAGRIFRTLPVTQANADLSREWMAAQ